MKRKVTTSALRDPYSTGTTTSRNNSFPSRSTCCDWMDLRALAAMDQSSGIATG